MTTTVPIPVTRSLALDRVRGVAIVLMVLDHVLELTTPTDPLRLTLTRMSMPLFFLVSGHLVKRLSRRTLGICAVGLILPYFVPWIDSPNVLVYYCLGAFVLSLFPPLPVCFIGLTVAANHFDIIGNSYGFGAVLGLMALGKMIPRSSFNWANALPDVFTKIGRYPLTIYVGHLLILEGITQI